MLIFFADADTGYIGTMGNSGKNLLKTVDGGTSWTILSHTHFMLRSVYFTSASIGYGVGIGPGPKAIISKTTDGGITWTPIFSGTNSSFSSVYFADVNNGYVVGATGTIVRTTDAGLSWTTSESGTNIYFGAVCMADVNTIYAVGAYGTILKSFTQGHVTGIYQSHQNDYADVEIFPNPVKTTLFITNISQNSSVSIYDLQGNMLINKQFTENNIDIGFLQKGIYIVKITDKHKIILRKVVKE